MSLKYQTINIYSDSEANRKNEKRKGWWFYEAERFSNCYSLEGVFLFQRFRRQQISGRTIKNLSYFVD